LFHDVVQVFALPQSAVPFQCPLLFQVPHGDTVGRVPIYINDPRHGVARIPQSPAKEALGRCGITPVRQQEIDRLHG
jgi:hypothetical protein